MSSEPGKHTTDQVLEAVIADAEAAFGKEAFIAAKEEFYLRFGKVFPEDPFYEARMSYFLDYFVLLRAIPGELKTPFLKFAAANKAIPDDLRLMVECFRHSIFEVASFSPAHEMMVEDLRTGATYKIRPKPGESLRGFSKGAIFQGCLFPHGEYAYLSNGLLMHPSQVLGEIKKFLKNSVNSESFDEQEALARLAFVQLRALRHSRAGAKRIYGNELSIS